MALPGSPALDREEAMQLIAELQEVLGRLDRLRTGLVKLVEEEA